MRKLTRRHFLCNSSAAAGIAKLSHAVDLWASTSWTGLESFEAGTGTTFFVATNGNDAWMGKLAEPNAVKTDGPFATLERARYAVRELKGKQGPSGPIRVMVRGGKYFLDRTLTFGLEDSGSREFPITYKAYGEEKPILSGGKRITNWKPYRGAIFQAELAGTKGGEWKFRQLFLNGKRQIRARYPKFDPNNPLYGGWLFIEGPAEERSQNSFVYRPGTFQRRWAKPTEAEVVIFPGAGWNDTTASIKTMDDSRRIITLARDIRNQDRPPWFSPFPLLPGGRLSIRYQHDFNRPRMQARDREP